MTIEIISAAIAGFEQEKRNAVQRIDAQIAELRAMLPGQAANAELSTSATSMAPARKRRKFSAAAIARMRAAQKARWAKIKGESEPTERRFTPAAPKRKRRMSKQGRARIVAATKARWDRVRAEKAQQEKAAKKSLRKTTAKKGIKKAATKKSAPATATVATQAAG